MPNVNPEILRWARETAGLPIEEVVAKLRLGDAKGVPAGGLSPSPPRLESLGSLTDMPLVWSGRV